MSSTHRNLMITPWNRGLMISQTSQAKCTQRQAPDPSLKTTMVSGVPSLQTKPYFFCPKMGYPQILWSIILFPIKPAKAVAPAHVCVCVRVFVGLCLPGELVPYIPHHPIHWPSCKPSCLTMSHQQKAGDDPPSPNHLTISDQCCHDVRSWSNSSIYTYATGFIPINQDSMNPHESHQNGNILSSISYYWTWFIAV